MIHDTTVEVTCDGERCYESVYIELDFVHRDYTGLNGYYDHSDKRVEEKLVDLGWVVMDGGHYCHEDCTP